MKNPVLLLAAILLIFPVMANAGSLEDFPACNDQKVVDKIIKRYNEADANNWQTGIALINVSQQRHRLTLAGGDRLIDRRYCRAHAHLSNGRHASLYYLIEQRQGFSGWGWNVEFCIPRADRWMAYSGTCRTLKR